MHVLVFTGEYEHTIDAKSRLAIPADLRSRIMGESPDSCSAIQIYVTPGEGQTLYLYTESGFEARAAELQNSQLDADQLLTYERMWFSRARCVEIDGNGRIRLPEKLLKRAGLGKEVVLLGVNDHLEVHGRDNWYAYVEQIYQEQPQLLVNPRRAIQQASSKSSG